MNSISYTLKHPIELSLRDGAGNERTELRRSAGSIVNLRRPRAKDLRIIDGHTGAVSAVIALLGALSDLENEEILNLDAEDFTGLGELLDTFMPDGPKTGADA